VQDFKILVDTFGFHLCSIDFRQLSDKNFATVKEYLVAIGSFSSLFFWLEI
jgi:phosphoenolpyruvate carboxylase